MKKNTFEYPKSSFFGMAKDTGIIMEKILSNQNVLRLLKYNQHDCLDRQKYPDIIGSSIVEMLQGRDGTEPQISNVPKVSIDSQGRRQSYLRLTFDSFTPSATNSFYRDHIIEIKIICHFADWVLNGFELRPYRIAGEIDSMLDQQKLTGIGVLNFIGGNQDIYDDEYAGLTLRYLADRGHEDDYKDIPTGLSIT